MLTPPQLIYRGLKGSALTSLEFDHDFRSLRDFANALAAFLGISINDDGSIKDGTISTSAKIADRIVTAAKLHWNANLFGTAAGTDAYTLTINPATPAITNYGDGISTTTFLIVKFTNANTTACTLALNGLAASPIKKYGSLAGVNQLIDLVLTDIAAGEIHLLAFDGTNWQLMTPHPGATATRSLFRVTIPVNIITPGPYTKLPISTTGSAGFDVDNVWNFAENSMVTPDTGYYLFMFEALTNMFCEFRIMKNVDVVVSTAVTYLFASNLWVSKRFKVVYLNEAYVLHMEYALNTDGGIYADNLWFTGYKLP